MIVVLAALPLGVSAYVLGLLTLAYYFGVFSMAWDLLFGFAGEVNFGPTFLIGLGAYTAGMLNYESRLADLASASSPARSRRWSAACCWRCRRSGCAARISAW